ncbi:multiple epidermal growth factor-like domains protein 11 [Saccostrea cucullata]|uniref:multiple epidermal growth factor-like domains protein 11 n=1 Tax=Saccostrea cuccullata TaxID=36930 RepID=UPI002ED5CF7A
MQKNNNFLHVFLYVSPSFTIVCNEGYYGKNCKENCSLFCKTSRDCHHVTGHCKEGCIDGWQGVKCLQVCNGKRFGEDCGEKCGTCLGYKQCNHINGCSVGTFGNNCEQNCNKNCGVPYQCDRTTGECEGGCQPGWEGPQCEQSTKIERINHLFQFNMIAISTPFPI